MTKWIDAAGNITEGDCPLGARAATAAETAAWEQAREIAAVDVRHTISWLDFVALFTPAEFGAIAVSTNPTVAAFRLLASGLGGDLNFADPRVEQGVDALIAAGVVVADRRAAILSRTPA